VPKDYLTQNLIGHFHFMLGVTFESRDWPRAESEFRRAMASAPDNDVLFYNLGLIYRRSGLLRRALDAFERARTINPRAIPSGKPVRAADRVAELAPEVERLGALETRLAAEAGFQRTTMSVWPWRSKSGGRSLRRGGSGCGPWRSRRDPVRTDSTPRAARSLIPWAVR